MTKKMEALRDVENIPLLVQNVLLSLICETESLFANIATSMYKRTKIYVV